MLFRWRRAAGTSPEAGYTLIEVLLASFVMTIIVGGVAAVMLDMEQEGNRAESAENASTTARTGLLELQRDLEAANPLVAWTSTVTSYGNELQLMLGPTGGTQQTITWSYTYSGSGSSCIGTLWRDIGTAAGTGDPEVTGMTNCQTGTPIFIYYGQQGENILANPGSVTSTIVTACSVRIQGAVQVSAGTNTTPFTENVSVRLANWQPGTQPCP
jgi:type II secretory pathway pseudopilin PulG